MAIRSARNNSGMVELASLSSWRDLYNVSFDVLRYALTSTYFEIDPQLDE